MAKINVVLDIDNVLTNRINPQKYDTAMMLFFMRYGKIIRVRSSLYWIFPGVIEFIKWIFKHQDIEVAFFSAGSKERNKGFVTQLLEIALPKAECNTNKSNVKIFSRDDLTPGHYWHYAKDIRKAFPHDDDFHKTILVDNEFSNAMLDHEKNLLGMHSLIANDFSLSEIKRSDPRLFGSPIINDDFFVKVNGIFYLTGILEFLLRELQTRDINPIDLLAEVQFGSSDHNAILQKFNSPLFTEQHVTVSYAACRKKLEFYESGRLALRDADVNPKITFVYCETVLLSKAKVATPEELQQLDNMLLPVDARPKKARI